MTTKARSPVGETSKGQNSVDLCRGTRVSVASGICCNGGNGVLLLKQEESRDESNGKRTRPTQPQEKGRWAHGGKKTPKNCANDVLLTDKGGRHGRLLYLLASLLDGVLRLSHAGFLLLLELGVAETLLWCLRLEKRGVPS